jgi:hypothetical protein
MEAQVYQNFFSPFEVASVLMYGLCISFLLYAFKVLDSPLGLSKSQSVLARRTDVASAACFLRRVVFRLGVEVQVRVYRVSMSRPVC